MQMAGGSYAVLVGVPRSHAGLSVPRQHWHPEMLSCACERPSKRMNIQIRRAAFLACVMGVWRKCFDIAGFFSVFLASAICAAQ